MGMKLSKVCRSMSRRFVIVSIHDFYCAGPSSIAPASAGSYGCPALGAESSAGATSPESAEAVGLHGRPWCRLARPDSVSDPRDFFSADSQIRFPRAARVACTPK